MPQLGEQGTPAPFGDKPRETSPGEIEVEQGNLLLMIFRAVKVPMPNEGDAAAVERTGVLLQRRFPWLAKIAKAYSPKV